MYDITPFLEKYYGDTDTILVGCSTGADSMFLLHKILETPYKKNVVACYFNHKLRAESDEEEHFLEELGKKEGFKVEIASCDMQKIQSLYPSRSMEELAREKRYQFFDALLNMYNSQHILTAHHLDDKIETFFFHLVRGSKLTGLINMTEQSGAILRPLLHLQKQEIQEYLNKKKLEYKYDKTNEDTTITRNFLRHSILPQFENVNENYKNNVSQLCSYFEEVKQHIDAEVLNFLGDSHSFSIEAFNQLSPFLQKEVIRYIYYVSNGKSTIGLSESNINEIIRFINGKNNKTIKEIRGLKMRKENTHILYS